MGGVLAGFGAGRDAQLQRRLTPCVYDEQPRLPVGLAVGAADQAPRACDSARGLTGKERAISRFVAPGPRVRIHFPPGERWYGAGGEEMAPSSLYPTDGVP